MTRNTKIILSLVGGAAVLVALGAIFGGNRDEADSYAWDTVTRGEIRETISASGEIQAKTKVNIGTMVGGEIKAIHVKDGQEVQTGDLLVTIDQVRLQQELTRSEAALNASRKDCDRAEGAMKSEQESYLRSEAIFRQGLLSQEDFRRAKLSLDNAKLVYHSAKSYVDQNLAMVAGTRDNLEKTVIRAPMAGRVTGLKAEKGETAIAGMTNLPGAVLMVVSDMSNVIAEVKVNESEVVRCQAGQGAQVTVESLPNRVFTGTVYEVATAAEKTGQDANMYKVKVALDMKTAEIGELRPGMSARAVILTSEVKNVLRIPLQSVLEREGSLEEAQKKGLLAPEPRSVVMTIRNGKAVEKPVKVGIANTQFFELKEGLSEKEQLLTGPLRKLKELKSGASVKLRAKSDTDVEAAAKRKAEKP
jgi:HlyD family secretion protein